MAKYGRRDSDDYDPSGTAGPYSSGVLRCRVERYNKLSASGHTEANHFLYEGTLAERNEDVMNMVRSELEKDPKAGLESLYARAKAIDSSVSQLSLRQFHARYPLQVKRGKAKAEGRNPRRQAQKKRTSRKAAGSEAAATPRPRRRSGGDEGQGADREKLRTLFLEFATEFAAAESRTDIVRVISSVDSYVDRVSKLAGR